MYRSELTHRFLSLHAVIVFTVIFPTICSAFEELLSIPWGTGTGNAGYRAIPSGCYGPSDFLVRDISPSGAVGSYLYLLDTQQCLLQVFDLAGGEVVTIRQMPLGSRRFAFKDGRVAVWDGLGLHVADWGEEWRAWQARAYPFKTVNRLHWLDDAMVVKDHRGQWFLIEKPGSASVVPLSSSPLPSVRKLGKKLIQVQCATANPLNAAYPRHLGAVQFVGSIAGHYCLLAEEVLSESPIDARELLLLVSPEGEIKRSVSVPFLYFTELEKSFFVHDDRVYGLISSPRGLHLLVLDSNDLLSGEPCFPAFEDEPYHYNEVLPALPPSQDAEVTPEDPISRTEMMANAREYTDLLWTATAENTTDGVECLPDGAYIRTPSWVTVGLKRSMPYKWGGFTSISDFAAGVGLGKKCGDDYTHSMSLTDDYCIGVDCSGFVSRCWGTNVKYKTFTIHEISHELDSFYDMKRGDALNQPHHHIRLCAEDNPLGMVLILESGADWRVSYRSKKLISLVGYTPIRFNEVIEEEPIGPFVIKAKESGSLIAVHREPAETTPVVAYMSPGQRFVSGCFHDGWYHLHLPTGTGIYAGWGYGGTTSCNGSLEGDQAAANVRITAETLNLREGPGPEYPYVSTVAEGQRFALTNAVEDWYEIEIAGVSNHETGWLSLGESGEFAVVEQGGPEDGYGATVIEFRYPAEVVERHTVICTLEVTNSGCCSWDDSTVLRTTRPRGRSSLLATSSWIDSSTVCAMGAPVLPYQRHTLTFAINAPLVPSDTTLVEHFGFERSSYCWFGDPSQRGPADDGLPLCVTIHDAGLPVPPVIDKSTIEIAEGALVFSWMPVEDALYYGIFRGRFGSENDLKPIASSLGLWFSSTYGVGDATRNFYYRIRAYTATDFSDFSEAIGEFDVALRSATESTIAGRQ
jgi:hypothetical protein